MTISSTFLFSLSGMDAARTRLDVSANNLANMNTSGFKAQRVTQADLRAGGTIVSAIDTMTQEGPMTRTGNVMDLMIHGNGFFQVRRPDGATFYSRDGSFRLDGTGRIVDSSGNSLVPPMTVPANAQALNVGSDGSVGAVMPDGTIQELGRIELARFANPGGLVRAGENLLSEAANSGNPATGVPGQPGFGALSPMTLEGSNVDMAAEMVDQIISKHSFAANVQTARTADEMLGTLLDIKE